MPKKSETTTKVAVKAGPDEMEVKVAMESANRILTSANDMLKGYENAIPGGTTEQVVKALWAESTNIGNDPKVKVEALKALAKLSHGIGDIRMRAMVQYAQTMQVIAAARIHANPQDSDDVATEDAMARVFRLSSNDVATAPVAEAAKG